MSAGRNNRTLTDNRRSARRPARRRWPARTTTRSIRNWSLALGTLGGGNHFIELATDESGAVWVTLHSGSRGIGNKIGNLYIRKAQQHAAERTASRCPTATWRTWSSTRRQFDDYVADLRWAQEFARLNRDEMMDRVMMVVSHAIFGTPDRTAELEVQRINCHHNFSQVETHFGEDVWVTRKGAIQAKRGMWAMIPGSMGTRSYIVTGLENPMAFHSAPHGAGRRYSRTAARKLFTMKDLETAMSGIEFRHAQALLDEIPSAYKDIDEVIENARSLIEVKHTLRQFINVKGD